MLKDEATILKSIAIKLSDDVAVLVTKQYHTEENPATGKIDRSKSKYRWMARVFKIEDLSEKIKWMLKDENRLTKFKWPNDPWPYYVSAIYPEHYKIAAWLMSKLKKLKDWDEGQKILAGWKNATKTHKVADYNKNAAYDVDGYVDEAGNIVSLTNKDELLKRVGQNLVKNS